MKYVLDTNIFIEANNRYYGIDFCPAFWDWISNNDEVCSIDKVRDELVKGWQDAISNWVLNNTRFFKRKNNIAEYLLDISVWVLSQNYTKSAKQTFLSNAYYFLIAYAYANQLILVTHEKAENSLRRIKIHNVCNRFNIPCMNTFDMLRSEQVIFVLQKNLAPEA